jgi:hypothetical protein
MKTTLLRAAALTAVSVVMVACSSNDGSARAGVGKAQQALFDCTNPAQRLSCADPSDPKRRFVCHATTSAANPYLKLSVPTSSGHVPLTAHDDGAVDQAPGASGDDVGSGVGLDCECNPRVCAGVCTGAAAGTACDDGNVCTGEGACSADSCAPGAPEPWGTPCGTDKTCDASGGCIDVPHVVINEIESSGGSPGDWIELFNVGTTAANVAGYRVLDNDDTHTAYVIPAGTVIPVGGRLVIEEASLGFGLGGADSARLFDPSGALVDSFAWTAHAATTYGRCPEGSGVFKTTTSTTKGAANDCRVLVKINEVESNGGVPGDWVELYNAGPAAVDLSGFVFKDNDDTHAYAIPAGTTIAAGGYLTLEEAAFGFGLGGADSARLFDPTGTLIDTHAWTAHAPVTYGRCPNGTGAFTPTTTTKGAANTCTRWSLGGRPVAGHHVGALRSGLRQRARRLRDRCDRQVHDSPPLRAPVDDAEPRQRGHRHRAGVAVRERSEAVLLDRRRRDRRSRAPRRHDPVRRVHSVSGPLRCSAARSGAALLG